MRTGKKRRRAGRIVLILLALLALGTGFFFWSQTSLTSDTVTVSDPRLPAGFDGFRVAVVSDLHGATFGENNADLFAAVAQQKPDLIAVTGDLIDDRASLGAWTDTLAAGLAAIAPTYYVTGNHEWSAGVVDELKDQLRKNGVTVLENEYRVLERGGDAIVLAGQEDANGYAGQKSLAELTAEIRADRPDAWILLLAHRNTKYRDYAACSIDLTLCGHGHGGLVRLPFTDGLIGNGESFWFPRFTSGVCDLGTGQMAVSRGLGNNPGTFRLFNRPELLTVRLSAG